MGAATRTPNERPPPYMGARSALADQPTAEGAAQGPELSVCARATTCRSIQESGRLEEGPGIRTMLSLRSALLVPTTTQLETSGPSTLKAALSRGNSSHSIHTQRAHGPWGRT